MFHPQPQRSHQHRPQNPATDQNYAYGLPIGHLSRSYPLATGGALTLANKYQYNGIELNDDFGLNVDMARYRTLNSQIERSKNNKLNTSYGNT
ncbi:MAG: hypothetical protein JNM36_13075 [Chitinophagales bacterium]|nr:hypothetical protein [Chitinophagales bacterium]